MTPERKVKEGVKKLLKLHGAYYLMPVMNGMGAPALDFHCIQNGRAFCIETKAPGKKPTPRQLLTIQSVVEAGGRCFVVDGEAGITELETWLESGFVG
jgi:hypothetical protein